MKLLTKKTLSAIFLSVAFGFSACGNDPGIEAPDCGNGIEEVGEQCDDGDNFSGDGCSSDCELEEDECGNGAVNSGEQCDDGNNINGDGCDSNCDIEGPSEAEQIDAYVQGLEQLPVEESQAKTLGAPSAPVVDPTNDDYECVTQEFTQIERNVEISTFSANSSNLFPGALVRGDSVYTGLIDPIVLPLKPVQFSVSLQNVVGSSSATMQSPNIAEYRDKRNPILQSVEGDVIVNADTEVIQVNSKEELSVVLGVDVNTVTVDVGADFDFNSSEERSHFLVRARQALYTVDTVLPAKPSDLLGAGVSLEDAQAAFTDESPAMYVQQLIYGRLIYFTFESKVSSSELKAALEFAFNNGATQVDADAALDFNQILSETTIKGYIIGGSASANISDALGNSIDAIKDFIEDNTTFNPENPDNFGDIIGFKLGYLSDNSTAALSFGGTTTIRECLRARQKVDVELMGIEAISDGSELGNELEIYGTISTSGLGGSNILFTRAESNPVSIVLGDAFGAKADELNDAGLTALAIKQVTIDVKNNGSLGLSVNLDEDDVANNDEPLNGSLSLPTSQGFRGFRTIVVNNNGTEAEVHFRLTPVFE